MVKCPSCGAEVRGQKKFCGVCGGAVDTSGQEPLAGPTSGTSSIRLDADGLNMILTELSDSTRKMHFSKGKVHVEQGPIQGSLGLSLGPANLDARVTWNGPVGALHVQLEQVQMDNQGVEIQIKLSR